MIDGGRLALGAGGGGLGRIGQRIGRGDGEDAASCGGDGLECRLAFGADVIEAACGRAAVNHIEGAACGAGDLEFGNGGDTYTIAAMSWILLFVAGLLEIGWAVGLKYTEGFTRLWPTVGTVASMVASLGLLGIAMRELPVGTAYAVWTGIGSAGTFVAGLILFGEPATAGRLASAGLIVAGILGLKLSA